MSNKTTCDIYGLYGVSPADSHKDPLEKGHLRAAEGRAFAAEALRNHTLIPEEPYFIPHLSKKRILGEKV